MGRTPISVKRLVASCPLSCGNPTGALKPSASEEANGRAAAAGIAVEARPKAESAPEACSILRRVIRVDGLSGCIDLLLRIMSGITSAAAKQTLKMRQI